DPVRGTRGDGAEARFEKPRVVRFRARDAAERRADRDAQIGFRHRVEPLADREAGVFEGHLRRGDRKVAEAVHAARALGTEESGRIEGLDLSRDPGPQSGRIEPCQGPDAAPACANPFPELPAPGPDRRDGADPGQRDAALDRWGNHDAALPIDPLARSSARARKQRSVFSTMGSMNPRAMTRSANQRP